jgi:hypothetical protein
MLPGGPPRARDGSPKEDIVLVVREVLSELTYGFDRIFDPSIGRHVNVLGKAYNVAVRGALEAVSLAYDGVRAATKLEDKSVVIDDRPRDSPL